MTGTQVDLIGVFVVAIGAAATLYAVLHALARAGVVLPRWILPAGIGLAMLSYAIWSDYSWFERATMRLPAGTAVLMEGRGSNPLAPWTHLAPPVVRFAALDPASMKDGADGIRRAEIILVERRTPTLVVPQDFDCARRMVRPPRADWTSAADDDPAFAMVCAGGAY